MSTANLSQNLIELLQIAAQEEANWAARYGNLAALFPNGEIKDILYTLYLEKLQNHKRMLELLTDIVEGRGTVEHIELLEDLSSTISETALCGLGKSAPSPVSSTLK